MDAENGPIAENAMIRYQYKNERSGFSKEYTLAVYGDIVTGVNYRQLIPHLLVQHLSQLGPEEQRAVLEGISDEENSGGTQNGVVEGILAAFSTLEISIPGSLPLRLDYVDSMRHKRQSFDFKPLRNAVRDGRLDEVAAFLQKTSNLPDQKIKHWVVEGIHDIAMENWLTECEKEKSVQHADRFLAILDCIDYQYQEALETRRSEYKVVYTSLDLLRQSTS
jgi:hypothetical protein